MREVGCVINLEGRAMYWHEPQDRSVASIPDSRSLWDILWENRVLVSGFAHTHPGLGPAVPSSTDLSTFKAIEAGLGMRLEWWIATGDQIALIRWTSSRGYVASTPPYEQLWLAELRIRSGFPVVSGSPAV